MALETNCVSESACWVRTYTNYASPDYFVGYGFTFVLICLGLLLLTVASQIPYWSETDRIWKSGGEDDEEAAHRGST